jgi:hypothetical protein
VNSKAKSKIIILFDIKKIVHKEVPWQAKQPIPHTTVTFYGDCMKILKDFAPNFGDKGTSHMSFFQGKFDKKKQHTVFPHHPTYLCFFY